MGVTFWVTPFFCFIVPTENNPSMKGQSSVDGMTLLGVVVGCLECVECVECVEWYLPRG